MARREAGALFFIVNDHLGTPKEVVSEAGRLAWCADHDALETLRHTGAGVEQETGQPVYGRDHVNKCCQYRNTLQKVLDTPDLPLNDANIANAILDDINNALGGC